MTTDADVQMQTVRVPKDVLEALKGEAKASGRSVPKEIEHRLRQSLGQFEKSEGQASEWSKALGRLVTALAHNVALESQRPDEALATMEASAPALISGLLNGFRDALKARAYALSKEEREEAVSTGQELAQRVREAHAPRQRPRGDTIEDRWAELAAKQTESGSPLDPKELLEIQQTLLLSPKFLEKMKGGDKR